MTARRLEGTHLGPGPCVVLLRITIARSRQLWRGSGRMARGAWCVRERGRERIDRIDMLYVALR